MFLVYRVAEGRLPDVRDITRVSSFAPARPAAAAPPPFL